MKPLKQQFVFNLPIMNIVLRFDGTHIYQLSRDDTKITFCFNDLHRNARVITECSRVTPPDITKANLSVFPSYRPV